VSTLFYAYFLFIVFDVILLTAQTKPVVFKYLVSTQFGLLTMILWLLFLNGFVGFQFVDDGTRVSVWGMRLLGLLGFAGGFVTSALAGLNKKPATVMTFYVVYFVVNGAFILLFCVTQFILVAKRIRSWWPIGMPIFGLTVQVTL
jgi:hypothetical protein